MGYQETMDSQDKKAWDHELIINNDMWDVTDAKDIPRGSNIIHSMWAMKKKANGKYRAQLATRT